MPHRSTDRNLHCCAAGRGLARPAPPHIMPQRRWSPAIDPSATVVQSWRRSTMM
ncbi:hypothetical protein ACFFX0_23605 [Citricoccus parietis]|uniref:Uncharacterized protein n=1 Tax=Citricoccus parietis TaxID=592307 RepID=A0ABV5G542_9MICC